MGPIKVRFPSVLPLAKFRHTEVRVFTNVNSFIQLWLTSTQFGESKQNCCKTFIYLLTTCSFIDIVINKVSKLRSITELKGTVPRDFRLHVFLMNQFPPSPWVRIPLEPFRIFFENFWRYSQLKVETCCFHLKNSISDSVPHFFINGKRTERVHGTCNAYSLMAHWCMGPHLIGNAGPEFKKLDSVKFFK